MMKLTLALTNYDIPNLGLVQVCPINFEHVRAMTLSSRLLWYWLGAGNSCWKGRQSTVDLAVLVSLDKLLLILKILFTKYLRYWCESKDFIHLRDEMRWNFFLTESFRPGKPSFNTVNFCQILWNGLPNFCLFSKAWRKVIEIQPIMYNIWQFFQVILTIFT
jgi:hypothetical protein